MDSSLHYNLQSKELQKFLSKITGVIMMPNGSDLAIDGYPTILILLNGNDYNDFKDYSIERNVIALLDHKYPILHIEMDENKTHGTSSTPLSRSAGSEQDSLRKAIT